MNGRATPPSGQVNVGGNNSGIINTGDGNLSVYQIQIAEHGPLTSFLTDIVIDFSNATLAKLTKAQIVVPPDIEIKIEHNRLSRNMQLIDAYRSFGYMLETIFFGVENHNPNARFFVHQHIGTLYCECRDELHLKDLHNLDRLSFVRERCDDIVDSLRNRLISELSIKAKQEVRYEVSTFAIGLLIADSVMDCAVLERP